MQLHRPLFGPLLPCAVLAACSSPFMAAATVLLDDDWSAEVSATTSDNQVLAFDVFALRPDGDGNTALTFQFHQIKVEVLGATEGRYLLYDTSDQTWWAASPAAEVEAGTGTRKIDPLDGLP